MQGFQTFFSYFRHFVSAKLASSSINVKILLDNTLLSGLFFVLPVHRFLFAELFPYPALQSLHAPFRHLPQLGSMAEHSSKQKMFSNDKSRFVDNI